MHYLGIPDARVIYRSQRYAGSARDASRRDVNAFGTKSYAFGHFEDISIITAVSGKVQQLADFAIRHCAANGRMSRKKYALWFEEEWRRVPEDSSPVANRRFLHGVMNTNNMSILGLTIDYGAGFSAATIPASW